MKKYLVILFHLTGNDFAHVSTIAELSNSCKPESVKELFNIKPEPRDKTVSKKRGR